ncbi:hypothetical protein ACN47E_008443 [Coniothyrium glycines]
MPGGLHPPVSEFLSWPAQNTVDPETRPRTVTILAGLLGSLMLLVVGARVWVRTRITRNSGWDDWVMVVAMLPVIGLTINVVLCVELWGYNKHIWDLGPTMYVQLRKGAFIGYLLYIISGGLIKISILLFYQRLDARTVSRGFRYTTWICIICNIMYIISFSLVLVFACRPWGAFWDQVNFVKVYLQNYQFKCVNEEAVVMAASILSTVQDAVTAILPTLLFWNLQMPRRQKFALGAIFALGYVIVAIAAVRIYYMWRLYNVTYDITWGVWPSWLLTMLELQLGAICGSVPALKVFFTHYTQFLVSRLEHTEGSSKLKSWAKSGGSGNTKSKESTIHANTSLSVVSTRSPGIVGHDGFTRMKSRDEEMGFELEALPQKPNKPSWWKAISRRNRA